MVTSSLPAPMWITRPTEEQRSRPPSVSMRGLGGGGAGAWGLAQAQDPSSGALGAEQRRRGVSVYIGEKQSDVEF